MKFLNTHEIISAGTDGQLKLWDVNKPPFCLRSFVGGHVNEKNFVGLATNGDYIACGSEDNSLCIYYKVRGVFGSKKRHWNNLPFIWKIFGTEFGLEMKLWPSLRLVFHFLLGRAFRSSFSTWSLISSSRAIVATTLTISSRRRTTSLCRPSAGKSPSISRQIQ